MKLLYKELALAAHPTLFIFTLLGCLVIVPAYPYSVIFLFGCLAPYITFLYARETNDAWYTAVLPVTKKDIVRAKCRLIICAQLTQLLISIPFALLRIRLAIPNNPVGLDPTAAWYGFGLMIFALFDLIFFPAYYKSGYKAGKAFLLAMLFVLPAMLSVEVLSHIPALAWLDNTAVQNLPAQLPVLLAGALCYAIVLPLACRIAGRRFEQVDL